MKKNEIAIYRKLVHEKVTYVPMQGYHNYNVANFHR